jgi:hypothetical protein
MRRPPVLVIRRLGRHQADGLAYICPSDPAHKQGTMEVDITLTGRRLLETVIHELIHLVFPGMLEEDVARLARYLALCLWAWGVRIDEEHFKALVQGRDPDEV